MFEAGCQASASSNAQPRRSASALPTVVLPEPDTPITIMTIGFRRKPILGEIHRYALPLRERFKHPFEREFAPYAAHFIATVGMPRQLAKPAVYLHPARLDAVGHFQCFLDVATPDICRQSIMAVVRHAQDFRLVRPRNRNHYGAKNFLAADSPLIRAPGNDHWLDEIAFR